MNALPICLTRAQVFLLLHALEVKLNDVVLESEQQAIEDTANALRVTVGLAPEQMYEREEAACPGGCGKLTLGVVCDDCERSAAEYDPALDPANWCPESPEYSMSQRESDWIDYGGEDLIYPRG